MAWQNPKVDWSAADGVRDSDFNRIEGNVLHLYNTESLKEDTIVYVSTTGNDSTGTGASSAPYRTISKALSVLPKNLAGYHASVSIAAGTYAETVSVKGFVGGTITLTGVANANVVTSGLIVEGSVCAIANILVTVGSAGVLIGACSTLTVNTDLTIQGAPSGLRCIGTSRLLSAGTIVVTGTPGSEELISVAVGASESSTIITNAFVLGGVAKEIRTGLRAASSSVISYNACTFNTNGTNTCCTTGGSILVGSPANITKYTIGGSN